MLKYIKFGLILTLLFLSCKPKFQQQWISIDEHHVEIRLFYDDFGVKYAFNPVCVGTLTNRGTNSIWNIWIGVAFHPYIKGATDCKTYDEKYWKTLQPDSSMQFKVYGDTAYCLPDYEIPNITVISIRTKFRYGKYEHVGTNYSVNIQSTSKIIIHNNNSIFHYYLSNRFFCVR